MATKNNSKVTIKNISTSSVTIAVQDIHFHRDLVPGRTIEVEQDVYNELMFDAGMQNLIRYGFLKVTNEPDNAAAQIVEDSKLISLNEKEVEDIFTANDVKGLEKVLKKASPATKDTIVNYVIKKNIADKPVVSLIDKYCGINTLDAMNKQRQIEE